jgi:hypothetical protein
MPPVIVWVVGSIWALVFVMSAAVLVVGSVELMWLAFAPAR